MSPAPTPEREPPTDTAAGGPPPLSLPNSPYPGLRPFLDHEDMLMHGRQIQIADIVRRLGRQQRPATDASAAPLLTRFVAVIGGSGSGKSSLMRAGVVPYLRQFGIPEAGDLWESVVATPGTNFQPDADGVVRESPITRLAAKFEQVLRGEHSARRRDALAQMLRRDGGLGRMIDEFAPQLALPAGVRPEDACVLIVIDQFEELFHKTNAESADARALVERVIDHFHESRQGQGSSKCFLAITMRSEHLNDCAGFLGLPEAINSGGYLVSRLGEAQVREVIEKPAQRYLRLRQRERQSLARQLPPAELAALPALPRTVVFEDGVVDHLVAATEKIQHDPDHLPLLQHALARTWSVACSREGRGASDVPQQILLVDLWRAGQADIDPPAPPGARGNLLRLSLDTWAERTLGCYGDDDRRKVLDLMRRLAYKDLRTGNYNQQRLYVAQHPLGEVALKALLQGRWIDDVDYLHWDAEDPQRVTLKVSHESFIRGWKTLRKLADHEALRLDRFTQLLEATQIWIRNGRHPTELLEQRMLDRMSEAQVEAALGPPDAAHDGDPESETWQDWQRWLGQMPRGEALKSVSRLEVRDYLRQSVRRREQQLREEREKAESEVRLREENAKAQAEARTAIAQAEKAQAEAASVRAAAERAAAQKDAEDARRQGTRRIWGVAVLGALFIGAFALLVMVPVLVRSQHHFKAAGLANEVSPGLGQATIGERKLDLRKLIAAAAEFEQAIDPRADVDPWTAVAAPIADRVLALPGMERRTLTTLLPYAAAAVEGIVNRQLWQLLTHSLWLADPSLTPEGKGLEAGTMRQMYCTDDSGGVFGMVTTEGGARSAATRRRGILVSDDVLPSPVAGKPAVDSDDKQPAARQVLNRRVFSVQVTSNALTPDRFDDCQLGSQLRVMPFKPGVPASKAAVMVDATLGYLYLSNPPAEGGGQEASEVIEVLRLVWPQRGRPGSAELIGPFAVITNDSQAAAELRLQVTTAEGLPRPGHRVWRTAGGRAMQVGDRRWQLMMASAHAITPNPTELQPLQALDEKHICQDIGRRLQDEYKAWVQPPTQAGQATPANRSAAGFVPLDLTIAAVGDYCLVLERTPLDRPGSPEARDQGNLQVFRAPAPGDRDGEGKLLRANLVNHFDFGRIRQDERSWKTGMAGSAWDGWLILERPAGDASRPPHIGLSWSTAALRRLADALCTSHLAAESGKAPTPRCPAP